MGKCFGCGNEAMGSIPTSRIMEKLNTLFSRNDLKGSEALLDYWDEEARKLGDSRGLLTLLNEKVGLYRRLGNAEKGLNSCEEALSVLDIVGARDMVSGATVILNCATTMNAFGRGEESIPLYREVRSLYERELAPNDFLLAGLYNNTATALSSLNRVEEATELYLKAVDVLKSDGICGEIAVTYVNIAVMIAKNDPFDERIYEYMDMAEDILMNADLVKDGNYAFICSKCAPAFADFGYFITAKELEKRSKDIYEGA